MVFRDQLGKIQKYIRMRN